MPDQPTIGPAVEIRPLPALWRGVIGLVSGCTLLTALVMIPASVGLTPKPYWMVFGFEVCAALAGVIGLGIARRRFEDGQALGLACVAGTIAVGAFLWWFSLQPRGAFTLKSRPVPINLTPLVMARLGGAALLALIGALAVLRRSTTSWWYLGRAAAAGAPVLAGGVIAYALRGPIGSALTGMAGPIKAGLFAIVGLAAIAFFAIAVHCVIRAFEVGRPTAGRAD